MELQHLVRIGIFGLGGTGEADFCNDDRRAVIAAAVALQSPASRAQFAKLPKGTPFDPTTPLLSVVSYNLLAPLFVRTIDKRTGEPQEFAKFGWAEPAAEVLDWDARRPRLLAELQNCKADIICLQEVQFEPDQMGDLDLPAWLVLAEYDAQIPSQSSLQQMAERNLRVLDARVAIGCAILFRRDRLEHLSDRDRDVPSPNTLVPACFRGLRGSSLSELEPFAVFSAHLDAQAEQKRVDQLCRCLAHVRQMGVRETIIVGDMNTECFPGSCVAAMLACTERPSDEELALECARSLRLSTGEGEDDSSETVAAAAMAAVQGPTSEQLREWGELWNKAVEATQEHRVSLSHVPTGPTRAGFDHGKDCGPCVSWRLDHIFYTGRCLSLSSCWTALDADPESVASGLPNRTCPSDHLPVAACFQTRPIPCLDNAERAALVLRIEELEARQQAEQAALQEELDAAKPEQPAANPEVVTEAAGSQKKAKKKNERPSPEMIAYIQECRQRLRGQKEVHQKEREEFVAALSELELDAFESCLSPAAWVARDPKLGSMPRTSSPT